MRREKKKKEARLERVLAFVFEGAFLLGLVAITRHLRDDVERRGVWVRTSRD
jgi:hypothetical protein